VELVGLGANVGHEPIQVSLRGSDDVGKLNRIFLASVAPDEDTLHPRQHINTPL